MRAFRRRRSPLTAAAALVAVLGTSIAAWPSASDAAVSGAPVAGAAIAARQDLQRGRVDLVAAAAMPVGGASFNGASAETGADLSVVAQALVQGGAGVAVVTAAAASSEPLVGKPVAHSYSGRNQFWIPDLGLSRPVVPYPCSRQRPPDNFVYRWGCAGHNNVYILGHAWGVMKPLHDAYAAGRLHVGMLALYADGEGHIRAYRVTTWRVVDPNDSNWAVASQSTPSMTLQTCVGPNGRLRLNVRLVAVD